MVDLKAELHRNPSSTLTRASDNLRSHYWTLEGIWRMRYTADCNWTSGRFTVNDMANMPQFQVIRTDTAEGNIVSVLSPAGDKLAVITPRYGPTRQEITVTGQPPITVRHHGWFGRRYDIVTPMGEMNAILSDFSAADYAIAGFGAVRAAVSRGPRQRNLTLNLPDTAEAISLMGIILAIETIRDDRRDTQLSIPFLRLILMMIN